MAWTESFTSVAANERAERALRWPIGAASPLWALFGAAAGAGVAWWWATRWMRPVGVEALAAFTAAQVKESAEAAADAELRVEEAVIAAEAPAEPAAPAAETVAKPAAEAARPDDLTRLTGIGPKLSAALVERGVTRFAQIAAWTQGDLAEVDAALSLKGRAVREAWVAQAKRLAAG